MDPSSGSGSGSGTFVAPRGYALSGKIMLSAIVILFSVVLFVLFLQLYVRWYALRRSASRRRRPLVFAAENPAPPTSSAARGLDPELLKSIPVHVFTSAAVGGEESEVGECAVCLNDFEEGEKIRTLPQCRHRFHVECIDMWFHSHATCPLCRSAVETVPPPPPPSADQVIITISEEEAEEGEEEEEAPPSPAPQPRELCVTCQRFEEETGASSSSASESVALSIQLPARRVEAFTRGLDEEMGSQGGGFKLPGGSRIMSLKRLLSWDLRLYRGGGGGSGAEADLERGEAAERSPATPTTTSHEGAREMNDVAARELLDVERY